jgi:hypothetical protein
MGDIKVFRTDGDTVSRLPGQSIGAERSIQTFIGQRLDTSLGVHFLASGHAVSERTDPARGNVDEG